MRRFVSTGARGSSRTTRSFISASIRAKLFAQVRHPTVLAKESFTRFVHLGNDSDLPSLLSFLQFERRTHEWRLVARATANGINLRERDGIRNVFTVPAQQIIHAVDGGDGNVKSIQLRFPR